MAECFPSRCSYCDGRGCEASVYDDPWKGPGQTELVACAECAGSGNAS